MKRLLLVLVLLMTAGSLFAAELKVDGSAMVRGTYWSYDEDAATEKDTFGMFDYNFVFNSAFIANEKATVFTRLTFDQDVTGSGYVLNGNGENNQGAGKPDGAYATNDANAGVLNVERAYLNYKFHPALQLNTGLMGGGEWATSFGNNESNVMRVQAIGALSKDMIFIATYEKQEEMGAVFGGEDGEDDDTNFYYLSSILNFGPVSVKPLLVYATKGISREQLTGLYYQGVYDELDDGTFAGADAAATQAELAVTVGPQSALLAAGKKLYEIDVMAAHVGVNGDFGMIGFESEFIYQKVGLDDIDVDHTALYAGMAQELGIAEKAYGAYINVFAKVDALKAGLIYVYGSADVEDGRFKNGADFNPFVYMLDWEAADGFSVYALYADYTIDKLTVGAAFAYGADNMKDSDATFMEYDLKAGYAIDENTTYSVGFAYVQQSDFADSAGTGISDWNIMRLNHAMTIKF